MDGLRNRLLEELSLSRLGAEEPSRVLSLRCLKLKIGSSRLGSPLARDLKKILKKTY
jgi:hypothetical protein